LEGGGATLLFVPERCKQTICIINLVLNNAHDVIIKDHEYSMRFELYLYGDVLQECSTVLWEDGVGCVAVYGLGLGLLWTRGLYNLKRIKSALSVPD